MSSRTWATRGSSGSSSSNVMRRTAIFDHAASPEDAALPFHTLAERRGLAHHEAEIGPGSAAHRRGRAVLRGEVELRELPGRRVVAEPRIKGDADRRGTLSGVPQDDSRPGV